MTDSPAPETAAHVEKETLKIDVNIPEHDARVTTELFRRTRAQVLGPDGHCWVCNRTAVESGSPLELHHYPVERSLANLVDWVLFKVQALRGDYGVGPRKFDWAKFDPADWTVFVDDMTVNGLTLCRQHHIGGDEGIHFLPHPLWIAQRFAKEGYRFNRIEIIHHPQN